MTYRARLLASAVLGLAVAHPLVGRAAEEPTLPALPPVNAPYAANEATSQAVASRLGQGGLQNYAITVTAQEGIVELTGRVANADQRDLAVRLAKAAPGVTSVVDHLDVPAPGVRQVQGTTPLREVAPSLRPTPPTVDTSGAGGGLLPEPVPVHQTQPASPYDLAPPPMPPYSWPTYAPHNNFSRVAYPTAYPYQAFPYIGPAYPFPKVPLSWRAVKLEWNDGYWWFSKLATKHDWWRLRYW